MLRRAVLGIVLLVSWVGGTALGIAYAGLRTNAGRQAVVGWGVRAANMRLAGTLAVGRVGGSFFGGLEVADVALYDADGAAVVTADTLRLQYRVRNLLRRRLTFGELTLARPRLELARLAPEEPWNIQRVLGGERGDGGSGRVLAFSGVVVRNGSIVMRAPVEARDSMAPEIAEGAHGPLRVRRFARLRAQLPYVRVGGAGAPVLADVAGLTVAASDPALELRDARGRVVVWRDSLRLELDDVALPATHTTLHGGIGWDGGRMRYALRGEASEASLDDVRGLVRGIPPGLVGRVSFGVETSHAGVVRVVADGLDLTGRADGGGVQGRLGMVFGPEERWAFDGTDLTMDAFDLEYVRGYLDTLPLAGTYTGRLAMDGGAERLMVAVDGQFRDALVDGAPVTAARGAGALVLGEPDGVVFRELVLEEADVALPSVRRLAPAVALPGRLRGAGTLNGPWRAAAFDGELRYRDDSLPEARARGIVRLDTRGDVLDVWADLVLDSLDLDSFRSGFPDLPVTGAWAGHVTLAGPLDSLRVAGAVSGAAGAFEVEGALQLRKEGGGPAGLAVAFERLDLALLDARSPPTALRGELRLDGPAWPRERRRLQVGLTLDSSGVQDLQFDSAASALVLGARDASVERFELWSNGSKLEVGGGIGLEAGAHDTIQFRVTLGTLAAIEPLLASRLGPLEVTETSPLPSGSMRLTGRLQGTREALLLIADWAVDDVRRGDVYLSRGGGTATWVSASRTLRVEGTVDSLEVYGNGFGGARFNIHGRADSLDWSSQSRFGSWGAWIGGGRLAQREGVWTGVFDSLGVLLATGPWFATPGAVVAVDDSGATVRDLEFAHARSPARVAWTGRLPFRGAGQMTASVEALPVEDVWLLLQREYDRVSGEISGTATLGGTARAPEVRVAVALRDGVFGEFRAPYVESTLEYRNRRLDGAVQFFRRGERILDVAVGLPVDLALVGATRRQLPGPIEVRAVANGVDLSLLEATVPVAQEMAGTLDADFGIQGTWEQPELTGQITLRDGAAHFPALGVRHEALEGVLTLSGDTIHVERLAVRTGTGTAAVRGYVLLEELSRPILHLDAEATNFRAINVPDFLTLTASANLAFRGPFYGAILTGQATATRGSLHFADLLTKDIVNLQDTLFAEFVDTSLVRRQGLGAALQNRFLDSLRIDSLRVTMGSDFWMRSSEANIQLAGALFANKVRDRYRLDGTLQAPRGTYRLRLGFTTREFAVTGGTVRYLGTPDLNADLDIQAEHVVRTQRGEDVMVFVTIGGTVYEPELQLTSNLRPALSETEIISYLLFGAPSFQAGAGATGFQSRLISQQIFGALSSQFEYSLISDLGVPLDYVQIRPAAAGALSGLEVAAGKQFSVLGTTAFLSASPQICPRQELSSLLEHFGASLEFRLSRNWLLAASVDPVRSCEALTVPVGVDYQLGVDLFWETSY